MLIGMITFYQFLHLFKRRSAKRSRAAAGIKLGFALVAMTSASCAHAQDNSEFFRAEPPTASKLAASTCDASGLNRLPVRCWVGQQFIVLPNDNAARSRSYLEFEGMA